MKVLVAFATQFGSTKAIAEQIGTDLEKAGLDVTVASVEEAKPAGHDAFVIGSTVHAGHWLKPGAAFVRDHRAALAGHPVWLFSSGPVGDRGVAGQQPDPKELDEFRRVLAPRGHRVFAGSFDRERADFEGMGLIERTVVKRFLPEGDWRDWNVIDEWATEIAHDLAPVPATA